jgi:hypothetical protein
MCARRRLTKRIWTPPGLSAARKVTCSVVGPGADAAEDTSTIEKEFRGTHFKAYYPDDFGRRVFPGRYRWSCRVDEGVSATGAFVIRSDGTLDLPAKE